MMLLSAYRGCWVYRPLLASQGSQVISGVLPRCSIAFSWAVSGRALCAQSAYHMKIAACLPAWRSNWFTVLRSEGCHGLHQFRASGPVVAPRSRVPAELDAGLPVSSAAGADE